MFLRSVGVVVSAVRFRQRPRWVRPYLRDLYYRRLDQGPEPYRPRSVWSSWSRTAELSAFCHRINDMIPLDSLSQALTDKSYTTHYCPEVDKDVSTTGVSDQECNVRLSNIGKALTHQYMLAFLRSAYPHVPEEWIRQIVAHLISPFQLGFIAGILGLKDLVNYSDSPTSPCPNAPPPSDVLSAALYAIIAVIAEQNTDRALLFIRDFLLAPLVDLDLTGQLITIEDPMKLLSGILAINNRAPPESRLQRQTSMKTLMACYQVGIYSERELLGEAPGETLEIAEQEAAAQAVRNLLGLSDNRPPLQLHGALFPVEFGPDAPENVSLKTYLQSA